jgi:hypothetical protein
MSLPNIQQNNEQILNDIQSLQQMEKQIFNNLETNPNLSSEQQQQMVDTMNNLSNMRINLYKTLNGVNNYYENALNTSVGTLEQQVAAIDIVESELNAAKKRLSILEEEKNNKIRLVEINSYFGDKYAEHSQLMKIIIFILVPIIIFAILNNKGFISNQIYYILVGIVSFIGAIFFWIRFGSIMIRDNMNYQEYDWYFDPKKASNISSSSSNTNDPWQTTLSIGTCVGNHCCSVNTTYDASLNQCIPIQENFTMFHNLFNQNTEGFITENMVNNILTKTQQNKNKIDYDLRDPKPSNM